jgi:hypothetical protein
MPLLEDIVHLLVGGIVMFRRVFAAGKAQDEHGAHGKIPEKIARTALMLFYHQKKSQLTHTLRGVDAQISELFQTYRGYNAIADGAAQQLFTIRRSYSQL